MKKGSYVVNWQMAFVIAIVIIIFFLLVWVMLEQGILQKVAERFQSQYNVQACDQYGATTTDPQDPTKKRCI